MSPLLCGETHATVTDLHRVLEAVVELHLHAPVLGDGVQDHPEEQLPQALENSVLAGAFLCLGLTAVTWYFRNLTLNDSYKNVQLYADDTVFNL